MIATQGVAPVGPLPMLPDFVDAWVTSALLSRNLDVVNIRNPQRLFSLPDTARCYTHLIEYARALVGVVQHVSRQDEMSENRHDRVTW